MLSIGAGTERSCCGRPNRNDMPLHRDGYGTHIVHSVHALKEVCIVTHTHTHTPQTLRQSTTCALIEEPITCRTL